MSTAVLSIAGADYVPLLDIAAPSFQRFCDAHGYDLHLRRDIPAPQGRHPAWNKIPEMLKLLDEYDRVLLLDCDTVVVRFDTPFPFDEMQAAGCDHALGVHDTVSGIVPNTGVWAVTTDTVALLIRIWEWPDDHDGDWANEPWWEQSVYMELMGYHPHVRPCVAPTTPEPGLYRIGMEWNCPWNYTDRVDSAIIEHAGGIPDLETRAHLMAMWAGMDYDEAKAVPAPPPEVEVVWGIIN